MSVARLILLAVALSAWSPPSAHAEASKGARDADAMDMAYVTEATLDQEWIALDEQVERRQLERPSRLRPIDQAALHVNDAWKEGTAAPPPTEGDNGRVVFVYGSARPTVVCAPLRVCMIQLKAGETVTDLQAGDTRRWNVELSNSGSTTYVVLKPRTHGIETDLAVITDQRVYIFSLQADPAHHMAIVSFEYPDDQKAEWRKFIQARAKQAREKQAPTTPAASEFLIEANPEDLRANYELNVDHPWFCRRRRNCVDWAPVEVYDDGRKTFIKMPQSIFAGTLPVLFVRTSAGWEQVAYRVKGRSFVVDRIFRKAELVLGVGGEEGKVAILRKGAR